MASGDTLLVWTPLANEPPAANYATLDLRNQHPVLDFDAATQESAIFGGVLPRHYGGGGITATHVWMATSATSGVCRWEGLFERHQASTDDLDADTFAAAQASDGTAPATSGQPLYTTIAFTNGAQIDSLAAGESFRYAARRAAAHANDTMTGDGELLRVELKET